MAESSARERLTAAMLREEGWRLLDHAKATRDPGARRQLTLQALDLAQVAEMMDAEEQRKSMHRIIPAPRRIRRRGAVPGGTVPEGTVTEGTASEGTLTKGTVPPERDGSI